MSWKGSNSRLSNEDFSKGINGVSAISDIPDGYVLEAENVDLSEPGKIKKRPGYALYGCQLPVRTKRIDNTGPATFTFDAIPIYTGDPEILTTIFSNTGANAAYMGDSSILQIDDHLNTVYVTSVFGSGESYAPITTDTVLALTYQAGAPTEYQVAYFRPVVVYSDGSTGTARYLLPNQILVTLALPTDDLVGIKAFISPVDSPTFNRLPIDDVTSIFVDGANKKIAIFTFPAGSVLANIPVGTSMFLECGIRPDSGIYSSFSGRVTAKTSTTFSVTTLIDMTAGYASLTNLSILYTLAKHLRYESTTPARGFQTTQVPFIGQITLIDCVSFSCNSTQVAIAGTIPATASNELGFVFGLDINVGYVNCLSKYLDVDAGVEKLFCGYGGSFFVENPVATGFKTVAPLRYVGATVTISAAADIFSIPLTDANTVYAAGDVVTLTYATDWQENTVSVSYAVSSATATHLLLAAAGDTRLYIKLNTYIHFKRISSKVILGIPATTYFNGMTVQNGILDPLKPTYVVNEITVPEPTGTPPTLTVYNYMILDTEVEWESDTTFAACSIFSPVFPSGGGFPINSFYFPSDIVDYNTVEMERSIIIAARENGMWRYNGSQLVNMRIPRPPSGVIRNIRGTNGHLKIDVADDGLQSGRIYDFIVTYSYLEIVNGRLVNYESGLSPVGGYTIVSAPALDGSGDSQLVELLIPTLPLGIGLPATDMKINVYRTVSGRLNTQATSEIYLLETQVSNNPYRPYVTALVGTETAANFTEANYKILYASVQTDLVKDELAREIIDPPLASLVTTLDNRIIAANGGEIPYLNLICKDVFLPGGEAFDAGCYVTYTAPDNTEPLRAEYANSKIVTFVCVPVSPGSLPTPVSIRNRGTLIAQQFVPAGIYDVVSVAYADASHLFRIPSATIAIGTRYLLRFGLGKKEGAAPGGKDPYYDGYGFENQTFVGTHVANHEVSAQKKWVSKVAAGTVLIPPETFAVFAESQTISDISIDNGLKILSVTDDTTAKSDTAILTLKLMTTTVSYAVGNFLILKGLGSLGQIKDADGNTLSFDSQIICEVLTVDLAADPDIYTLAVCVMGNTTAGATAYKRVTISSALSVTNDGTLGVTHGPFTIYLWQVESLVTTFTLQATSAQITIATAPALTVPTGVNVIVDGLISDLPRGSNCNWNRRYLETTAYAASVFNVAFPKVPEEARGTIGQTLAAAEYGKLAVPHLIFSLNLNNLQILLTSQVLTVAVGIGVWCYIIVRGREDDSFYPQFSGFFKVIQVRNNAGAWVASLAVGAAMTGVEVELAPYGTTAVPALDFSGMTGVSETKIIFLATPYPTREVFIPVPVPIMRNLSPYLSDLTGTMYGPSDGFTPLEKIIKRLSHAINTVLHETAFAYWGGRRIGNDESSHPGNVLPTNGLKILPHSYPDNKQLFRYKDKYPDVPRIREALWALNATADWEMNGASRVIGNGASEVTSYTSKETRPSRVWWTNPTATLMGQAFRELSFDEVESQDGESVRAMVPMQTFGLLFKRSSPWRISFDTGSVLSIVRIPSIVGAVSAKNVIPTPKGAFVLHDSGVYFTDGQTMEDVLQPSRVFKERVSQNADLLIFTSGFHNPFTKTVYLGVPLSSIKGPAVSVVEGQIVFNYSNRSITLYSIDTGWSINTNIPATFWMRVLSEAYFASTKGKVFKLRRERTKTAYSDEREAISFKMRTRYVDATDPVGVRFYRSMFFQFGTETNNTMQIALTKDFGTDYTHVSSFTVHTADVANQVVNVPLEDKYIDVMRRTPPFPRAANLSVEITNEELDAAAELHGIFFESSDGTTKLVSQPAT